MDNSKIRPTKPKQQQKPLVTKPKQQQSLAAKPKLQKPLVTKQPHHIPDRLVTSKDGKKTLVMGTRMESTVTQEYANKMFKEKGVFLL